MAPKIKHKNQQQNLYYTQKTVLESIHRSVCCYIQSRNDRFFRCSVDKHSTEYCRWTSKDKSWTLLCSHKQKFRRILILFLFFNNKSWFIQYFWRIFFCILNLSRQIIVSILTDNFHHLFCKFSLFLRRFSKEKEKKRGTSNEQYLLENQIIHAIIA